MKAFYLNIIILFITTTSFSQEAESNNDNYQNDPSLLYSKIAALHLASNNTKSRENLLSQNNLQNGVLIQQIGNFNYIDTSLKAKEINVSVVQKGDENQLFIDKQANEITQKILQQGQNNFITDFSLYSHYNINMEIVQRGDNQNIQSFGTNSISKDMKIIQSGNGASVIIINK